MQPHFPQFHHVTIIHNLSMKMCIRDRFDTVLMIADGDQVKIGAPYIEGARVTATVKSQGRGPKVLIVKFRRRKHYRKTQGLSLIHI